MRLEMKMLEAEEKFKKEQNEAMSNYEGDGYAFETYMNGNKTHAIEYLAELTRYGLYNLYTSSLLVFVSYDSDLADKVRSKVEELN